MNGMKTSVFIRVGITLGSLLVYAVVFIILFPLGGPSSLSLAVIPMAISGWLLGVRGSLLFGILMMLVNTSLINSTIGFNIGASPPPQLPTNTTFNPIALTLLSNAGSFLIGIISGWIRALVDRVNKQAEELREEREILQEEIKKRIQAEERLTHEALHDPLTNLPNRRMFASQIQHALARNKRNASQVFAVLYLDFDRFKIINDSLGHNVGDDILIGIAQRLKSSVRAMDTVARMGGDEFAILLEAVNTDDEVIMIVKRLQRNMTAPFEVGRNSIVMTASIGIVPNLLRYEQIDDIIRDADIAMYSAKVSGRNQFRVFDVAMREEAEKGLSVENDLRNALRNGEFRIHYQPILSLKTRQLTGFEALLRWQHPEKGLMHPNDFMAAAEESGLIVPIGQWVLYESCRQMKAWQSQFGTKPSLTMSVNFSSRQFAQADLVQQIQNVLEETGLPAKNLFVELTEITLIGDMGTASAKISQLRALGVGIEIDDFGTGYSSLSYLRQLPINNLKIDRSFISALGLTKSGLPVIRAIIGMANSLDMKVIAEGIETESQVDDLKKLDCDYGQGFLFNEPIDPVAAQDLIKEVYSKQRKVKR
jgi:diguanylate cyclase (GGDEF)-like protein